MCARDIEFTYSTIFLLNAGTVSTMWYIFFHFIIGYEKKTAELQLLKVNMVVIIFRNESRQNEIQPN
jgi:ABC-type anion transport system duplicated permease subunit